jgi:hypothetical protein
LPASGVFRQSLYLVSGIAHAPFNVAGFHAGSLSVYGCCPPLFGESSHRPRRTDSQSAELQH